MPRPARRGSDAQWDNAIYGDTDDQRGTRQHKKKGKVRRRGEDSRYRRDPEPPRFRDDWADDDWDQD